MTLRVGPVDWLYSVYVVGSKDRPVKIGRAKNVNCRLVGLQTGSPDELFVLGSHGKMTRDEAIAIERSVHELLKDRRLRGEWFDVTADEAMALIWQQINNRVYVARGMATKDLRGYIDQAKWQQIANVAHSAMNNA
jgi:hypothetical protein